MKIKLASINLEVADVERSKQFYAGVLDMVEDARRSHPPGFAYLRSDGCDVTLAAAREVPKAGPPRTVELGFEVDELPAMRARLASRDRGLPRRVDGLGQRPGAPGPRRPSDRRLQLQGRRPGPPGLRDPGRRFDGPREGRPGWAWTPRPADYKGTQGPTPLRPDDP